MLTSDFGSAGYIGFEAIKTEINTLMVWATTSKSPVQKAAISGHATDLEADKNDVPIKRLLRSIFTPFLTMYFKESIKKMVFWSG